MFPALTHPAQPPAPLTGLRARLVRGLDLAVEFATLGEYGVEEVEAVRELPPSSWDWPARCPGGRPSRSSGAAGPGAAGRNRPATAGTRRARRPGPPSVALCLD